MKKRLFFLLALLCFLVAAALSSWAEARTQPEDAAAVVTSVEETGKQDPAQAYYQVFLSFWNADDALQSDIHYLAIDLKGCKLENPANLIAALQAFCDEHGLTLLQDDYEGLTQKGYISTDELYWPDGVIISFADKSLTKTKLVTEAKKWRSGIGAIGVEYTAKRGWEGWRVTRETMLWIS